MALSKKLLIGLGSALATSAVIIGTSVGITLSQKRTNLAELAAKITKDAIVIKSLNNENEAEAKQEVLIPSDLYAFNIKSQQLSIKDNVLPNGIKATLSLGSSQNDAAYLNSGKLKVGISLEEERFSDNTHSFEVEIDQFKTATKEGFETIFDASDNEFALNISPSWDEKTVSILALIFTEDQHTGVDGFAPTPYATVDYLNDDSVPVNSTKLIVDAINKVVESITANLRNPQASTAAITMAMASENMTKPETEPEVINGNGLTAWLYGDTKKGADTKNISIDGKVKVSKLSGDDKNTYFHLVSKDENSRIKLIKKENDGSIKEVALNEIKTTNLLASDVTVKAKDVNHELTNEFLNSLKSIGSSGNNDQEEEAKKYLQDETDESLNRDLSIILNETAENKKTNRIFIKPNVVNWKEDKKEKDIPVSITVSFGQKDYATSFSTNVQEELDELKAAGFSFNLFTKKLEGNENLVNASKFTMGELKDQLLKYFKESNYNQPVSVNNANQDANKFTKTSSELKDDNSSLKITLAAESHNPMNSQNWLAFATYTYKGITNNNALLTPSLSLIRIEAPTITS